MAWLGFSEIVVIMVLVLILFGPKKLPEIGKLIGMGMKELKKYSNINLEEMLSEDDKQEIPEKLTESPDPAAMASLDPGNATVVESHESADSKKQDGDLKDAADESSPSVEQGELKSATEVIEPDFDEKKYPENMN